MKRSDESAGKLFHDKIRFQWKEQKTVLTSHEWEQERTAVFIFVQGHEDGALTDRAWFLFSQLRLSLSLFLLYQLHFFQMRIQGPRVFKQHMFAFTSSSSQTDHIPDSILDRPGFSQRWIFLGGETIFKIVKWDQFTAHNLRRHIICVLFPFCSLLQTFFYYYYLNKIKITIPKNKIKT